MAGDSSLLLLIIVGANTEGVDSELVSLVMNQTSCTLEQAVEALKETNGDVVNAIMKLSVQ